MSHSANAAKSFFRRTQSTLRKFEAWHTWILICAAGAGVTFCFNLALTIWASTFGLKNGTATMKVGKCSDIKTWDLWFHLGINVLSSTLLAASNYTMQCLSAPVREEIDKGHRERIAFDIGIPSLKNLRRIPRIKFILWGLLAVSSIPLHLVYNSVIFSTLSTHSYLVLLVTSEFLSGAPISNFTPQGEPVLEEIENIHRNVTVSKQDQSNSKWQKLDSTQCREAYRLEILSDRSDVLVVSSANSTVSSLLDHWRVSFESGYWTCPDPDCKNSTEKTCDPMCDHSTTDYFQLYNYPIDHCLSWREAETCQFQFSLPIMIIVMICNLTKTICMLLTIRHRFATPLLTLGDAVASFLKSPDIYTRNNCLSDMYNFQHLEHQDWEECTRTFLTSITFNGQTVQGLITGKLPPEKGFTLLLDNNASDHEGWSQNIKEWIPKRHFWFSAASPSRWLFSLFL